MKTTLKQIAAATFMVLLVLAGNIKSEGTELKASGLEITETSLQLENWMVSELVWNTSTFSSLDFALETEVNLEMESWMFSETVWNTNSFTYLDFVPETEATLEIESWMTNETIWNVEREFKDAELQPKDRMVETEVWK